MENKIAENAKSADILNKNAIKNALRDDKLTPESILIINSQQILIDALIKYQDQTKDFVNQLLDEDDGWINNV